MNDRTTLTYIRSLAKKLTDSIGFIPDTKYEIYLRQDRLKLQFENAEPCGFLAHGPLKHNDPLYIYQAAIQTDARRRHNAEQMVTALINAAKKRGVTKLALRCAADLESNHFWAALGFELVGTAPGGSRRARTIHLRELQLSPVLF